MTNVDDRSTHAALLHLLTTEADHSAALQQARHLLARHSIAHYEALTIEREDDLYVPNPDPEQLAPMIDATAVALLNLEQRGGDPLKLFRAVDRAVYQTFLSLAAAYEELEFPMGLLAQAIAEAWTLAAEEEDPAIAAAESFLQRKREAN